MGQTVAQIKQMLAEADAEQLAALERTLAADERKGVVSALAAARKRVAAQAAEEERLAGMYRFQQELAAERGGSVVLGLDEVGRGPLAGPLAIGGVVLPAEPLIAGLNDSKKVAPKDREAIAAQVKEHAVAWTIQYIQPEEIDSAGMTACLRKAFVQAIADIESQGVVPDVVLLDGNPLHLDPREVNVIKGDGKCAAIAAASIVAKVDRDALMCQLAQEYPQYGFDGNKGYGSAAHMDAIREFGLSPVHRRSFCTSITQPTLF
ncbi:MAG: ribonuclease HII [Coriobacteriia bacterium]|nr:ribonuclease HII [Coriobacteriia bacterium]